MLCEIRKEGNERFEKNGPASPCFSGAERDRARGQDKTIHSLGYSHLPSNSVEIKREHAGLNRSSINTKNLSIY